MHDATQTNPARRYDVALGTTFYTVAQQLKGLEASDIIVSPGAGAGDVLAYTPCLRSTDGALTIRMGSKSDVEWQLDQDAQQSNPRQVVREIVHLRSCDLVIVVADDVFVLTSAEYAAQV